MESDGRTLCNKFINRVFLRLVIASAARSEGRFAALCTNDHSFVSEFRLHLISGRSAELFQAQMPSENRKL
jgi:hypothetical protein